MAAAPQHRPRTEPPLSAGARGLESDEPDAKRRREEPPLEGARQQLLDRWQLTRDPAVRQAENRSSPKSSS